MIQDIAPHRFDNSYHPGPPSFLDIALCFSEKEVLLKNGALPHFSDLPPAAAAQSERLFSIDETGFFLAPPQAFEAPKGAGFLWHPIRVFRSMHPSWMAFGGITGCQLWRWEQSRQYCGRCGKKMQRSKSERALFCPACGLMEYPKICPAVIVAISDGDKLLMARNVNSQTGSYALIAGFVEIGESFEQAVRREAMEEVGVRLKNIRYYKSQPWSFSDTIMIGFTAELDGSPDLRLQESEIADAKWVPRSQIPPASSLISVGGELIENFRLGRI